MENQQEHYNKAREKLLEAWQEFKQLTPENQRLFAKDIFQTTGALNILKNLKKAGIFR